MNLSLLVTRALGSSEFFLRKNAPTILTGAGVVGFIATVGVTVHVSPKAVDKLQAISLDVADVKSRKTDDAYTEQDRAKDLTKVYVHSALEIGRVYGPTLIIGSASIACVISAHTMMLRRQASLVAAYTALSAAYEAYRKRVAVKVGPEEEELLYRGVMVQETCGEDGQPCEIIDMSDVMPSVYSFWFDEASPNWKSTAEYNKFFLRSQQDHANHKLHTEGFLFLNEVLEWLGLPRTQAGQVVGWRMPKEEGKCRACKASREETGKRCMDCRGDGYVDFGMYDVHSQNSREFVNTREAVVLLDFNVDGPIIRGSSGPRDRIS